MSIISITDRKDMKSRLKSAGDKLIVVSFTASRCTPCQTIAPYFEKLSQVYNTSSLFFHVNIENDPENTAKFNVTVIPTFIFIKKLNVLDRYVGVDQYMLEEKLVKCQAIRVVSDTAVKDRNNNRNKARSSGDRQVTLMTTTTEKPAASGSSDNSLSSSSGNHYQHETKRRSKSRLGRHCGC